MAETIDQLREALEIGAEYAQQVLTEFDHQYRHHRSVEDSRQVIAEGLNTIKVALAELEDLAKQQKPVAWFVRRNAPGRRDDGMRLGPFWKRKDAEEWTDAAHTLHELYLHPAIPQPAAVPDGWNIKREGGEIIVQKDGIGGYVAHQDADNIASEILYWLANDLLSAAPTPLAQDQGEDRKRLDWLDKNFNSLEGGIPYGSDIRETIDAAIDAGDPKCE